MAVTDLTGTRWRWNWGDHSDPSSCEFSGATQAGVVKNINFTASWAGGGDESEWTSMKFKQWHGGDINEVDYDSTRGTATAWFSDIDGGEHEADGTLEEFYITGGSDVTNAQLIGWLEANAVQVEEPQPSGGSISIGSSAIAKAFIGTNEVSKMYLGDSLIYEASTPVDPVFANNDWATIRAVVRSGNIPATWAVGDTKDITLSSGQTISYRITDKQAGRYALADDSGSSNMVLEPIDLISNLFAKMNSSGNDGGFAQSEMRTVTLANVLSMFPTDVQNVMSEVLVLSGTGNSTTSGTSSSTNKLFLAAEMELLASGAYSIGNAECPLGQFDYYKTHNSNADRIKQRDGSAASYWLRSPNSGNSTNFCYVNSNGIAYYNYANGTSGVAPLFAI